MRHIAGEAAAFLLLSALSTQAVPAAAQIGLSFRVVGQIGGPTQAVAVQGNYAYVGVGLRLVVLDVSNPAAMHEVGATAPFPHFVEGVAVSGTVGYVAAGGAGLRVVDVSRPERPTEIGAWDTRGYAEGVAVVGTTVYLVDGPYGLRIFDVSNPRSPKEVGAAYVMNYAFEVAVAGPYAYIAAGGAGLLIADVSNPSRPVEVGAMDTPGYAYGVAAAGSTVYVADGWEGFRVVGAADPAKPVEIGSLKTPGWAFGVAVSGTTAFVADAFKGLRVLDVSSSQSPRELGGYEAAGGHAGSVAVAGGVAYVADRNWGLRAVGVSTPSRPARVGFYAPLGYAEAVAVAGNHAYVAASTYGLRVVDISDPARPKQVSAYDTEANARSVVVVGRYVYVAAIPHGKGDGLHVLDISNPSRPARVGFYLREGYGCYCGDLAVAGGIAYLPNELGLELVSVADPFHPTRLGFVRLAQRAGYDETGSVAVSGRLAYVTAGWAGLDIVDVSNPRNPALVGALSITSDLSRQVRIEGDRGYLVGYDRLHVLDLSNPTKPAEIGLYDLPGEGIGIAVSGGTAFLAHGGRGVSVIDVSDPLKPKLAAAFDTPGYASGVAVAGNRVYVADGRNGLLILEMITGSAASKMGTNGPEGQRVAEVQTLPRQVGSSLRFRGSGGPFQHTAPPGPQTPVLPAGSAGALATEPTASSPEIAGACAVTSTADSGPGTLRWCLESAGSGTTIAFDASVFPPARPATIAVASPLPPVRESRITIDGSDAGVVLDGSRLSGWSNGLHIGSEGSAVRGLQIFRFPGCGIFIEGKSNVIGGDRSRGRGPVGQGNLISANGEVGIGIAGSGATGNIVVGNLIGTDASGTKALGNKATGVFISDGASNNRVGATDPRERNILSGNGEHGLSMTGSSRGNLIIGNYVGTDVSGTIALGNRSHGISMELAGFNNVVQGNLSSGNGRAGVLIGDLGSDYNVVVGNFIGTDASGSKAIPNDWVGVAICWAAFNRIGGTRAEERNLISGNRVQFDIFGASALGNLILGNFVGTDVTGTQSLGDVGGGSALGAGSRTLVGGATAQERNVISGSGWFGLEVASDYNSILGNYIGTDASGRTAVGNRVLGVWVTGAHSVIQGNVIAHTTAVPQGGGAGVSTAPKNVIRRNSIYSNAAKGIQIDEPGRLSVPRIIAAGTTGVWGSACPGCEVEIFSDDEDEGRVFEGSVMADSTGAFRFEKGGALAGPNITTTATDAEGSTSEFSRPQKLIPVDGPLVSLSAAGYAGERLAADSIATAFGSGLASATEAASGVPLPSVLAGTTVSVLDSAGVQRAAPLYFVSPTQVNYVIPPDTAMGSATVILRNTSGASRGGVVEVVPVAPGLFSVLGTGQGLAAANVLRVRADGTQTYEPVTQPIDLGPETDQVYLLLYGTGIRRRSSLGAVRVRIGGAEVPVSYAGPQPHYPGLDQVNALLPRSLRGRGEADVALVVDGKAANTVRLHIR